MIMHEQEDPIVFEDLDLPTQKFLRDARAEDILYLKAVIKQQKNLVALRRLLKWVLYTAAGGLTLAASFGDSLVKLYRLWKGVN